MLRVYSQRVLNLKESERAVVANGRVLGPLEENESFSIDDFNLLERFSSTVYLEKINNALTKDSDEEDGKLLFGLYNTCIDLLFVYFVWLVLMPNSVVSVFCVFFCIFDTFHLIHF